MYAIFNNIEEFNLWHSQVKESLGYPLQCYRGDGSIINNSFVEEYTTPIIHPITNAVAAPIGEDVSANSVITHEQAIALGYLSAPSDPRGEE